MDSMWEDKRIFAIVIFYSQNKQFETEKPNHQKEEQLIPIWKKSNIKNTSEFIL